MNGLHILAFFLGLPTAAPVCGGTSDAPAAFVREEDALARALEAVCSDAIRADLRFIASDELEGRDTPSQGLRMAARFIRARLARLGFVPLGDDGGFFHHYRMGRNALRVGETMALILDGATTTELVFGRDYYFWPNGVATLDRTGEVVFVGQAKPEELASLEFSGRFAFAFDERSTGERRGRGRAVRERQELLKARGAIGLVVASPLDGQNDAHGGERAAGIAGWAQRGDLDVLSFEKPEVWPQINVSADTARKLLAKTGEKPELGASLGVSLRDVRAAECLDVIELENVAGLWLGSDPELSKEVIVVSAHYDHVGVQDGEIYNGADDNGSGTCGMLAIAEALAAHGPLRRSILLLWLSGEEKGLKGSYAWTKDPSLGEGQRVVCDLNLDMIGRNAPDYLLITPTREHEAYNGLARLAERLAPLEGFPKLGGCDEYWARSDQMNFSENLGVPVAFLFSGEHEDYHGPGDEADKIDYDKVARVARLVVRILDGLQGDEIGL